MTQVPEHPAPNGLDLVTATTFVHDALFYDGAGGFLESVGGFVLDARRHGEPVLVMVTGDKVDLLRDALGEDGVRFEDMGEVGRNPARIIPAWREFFTTAAAEGTPARGVGEPIWPSRSTEELRECQRHEELINLAFARAGGWLICPYDVGSLDQAIIEEALRSHPGLLEGDSWRASAAYRGLADIARPFDEPLPEPPPSTPAIPFGPDALPAVRRLVHEAASAFGLDRMRAEELVLAVSEVAANSLRHGGGRGTVCLWQDGDALICEIRDGGRISDPLAGRSRPESGDESGMGLWLANQLCDLVQVRSLPAGTIVRLSKTRAA